MKDLKYNYFKIWLYTALFLIIITLAPISYAFFTTSVTGNSLALNNVIESGILRLKLTDGNVVGTTTNMIPGSSITKSFTIENTGTITAHYSVYLKDVLNEFADKSDLVYEIIGTSDGSNMPYSTLSQVRAPSRNAKIIDNITIDSGEIHSYSLILRFLNKNEAQDDNMNKSFSATIGLYDSNDVGNMDEKTLIDKMEELYDSQDSNNIQLLYDGTTDNNLRYVGTDPDNYIYFNGELWRIIGKFNNIEKADTSKESLLKIIKYTSIGQYSWDASPKGKNNNNGINQWGESTFSDTTSYEGADLMVELNNDYLGNIVIGTDEKWYIASNASNTPKGAMPSERISSTSQNMIETVKWYTGSNGTNAESTWTPYNMYEYERSNNSGKNCSGYYCNDGVNRTTNWVGKVGLLYPSDYGFATSADRDLCLNFTMNSWNDSSNERRICRTNDWLKLDSKTLTPYQSTTHGSYVFSIVSSNGQLRNDTAVGKNYVYPVVYLKSDVKILSGDGKIDTPYYLNDSDY